VHPIFILPLRGFNQVVANLKAGSVRLSVHLNVSEYSKKIQMEVAAVDAMEESLTNLRAVYREYFIRGKIYGKESVDDLLKNLHFGGFDICKRILIPAKTLLKEHDAPVLDNACESSLLSPTKTKSALNGTKIAKNSAKKRRPVDEPSFLEFLGSLERAEHPGQNTDVWRYIFKKNPLNFAGLIPCYILCSTPCLLRAISGETVRRRYRNGCFYAGSHMPTTVGCIHL
jgi:hypothetical protein